MHLLPLARTTDCLLSYYIAGWSQAGRFLNMIFTFLRRLMAVLCFVHMMSTYLSLLNIMNHATYPRTIVDMPSCLDFPIEANLLTWSVLRALD
jgi:hypothetical protein